MIVIVILHCQVPTLGGGGYCGSHDSAEMYGPEEGFDDSMFSPAGAAAWEVECAAVFGASGVESLHSPGGAAAWEAECAAVFGASGVGSLHPTDREFEQHSMQALQNEVDTLRSELGSAHQSAEQNAEVTQSHGDYCAQLETAASTALSGCFSTTSLAQVHILMAAVVSFEPTG